MALRTVYDSNNVAIVMEGVDARECVATGRYTYDPQEPAIAAPAKVPVHVAEDKTVTIKEPAMPHEAKPKAGKK